MKNRLKDKLIDAKIETVLSNIKFDNTAENYKKIVKTFGSINYQYNGNSLYHLFTQNKDDIFSLNLRIEVIKTLVSFGLNPNIRNNEGKTFLQSSGMKFYKSFVRPSPLDKMNLNNQDNEGKTILHNLVDEATPFMLSEFYEIYKILKEYVDINIKDNNGQNYLNIVEEKFYYSSNDFKLKILRKDYYQTNFNEFIGQLSDNISETNKFLNSLFGKIEMKTLHYWCQENRNASEEDKLRAIEKLFALGIVDPNYFDNNPTIVIQAINKNFSTEYILKLSELCLKYGSKVNNSLTIMKCYLNECHYYEGMTKIYEELTTLYVALSKYGYNKLKNDINQTFFLPEKEKEMYAIIRQRGFIIMINTLLKEKGLTDKDIFLLDNDLVNDVLEVENMIGQTMDLNNDYDMAKLLVETVIKNRENNINIIEDNSVSLKEIVGSLKYIMEEFVSNKVKPMVKKIDRYY